MTDLYLNNKNEIGSMDVFSHPYGTSDKSIVGLFLSVFEKKALQKFYNQQEENLNNYSPSLKKIIQSYLADEFFFEFNFDLHLSCILSRYLQSERKCREESLLYIIQIGIEVSIRMGDSHWEIAPVCLPKLLWRDIVYQDYIQQINVVRKNKEITLFIKNGTDIHVENINIFYEKFRSGWKSEVVHDVMINNGFHDNFETIDSNFFNHYNDKITNNFSNAFSFLKEHSPTYYAWVKSILQKIVVSDHDKPCMKSSSRYDSPGTVRISSHREPEKVAEMLVHESSHQYYYTISRILSLCDPHYTKLIYSPVKKCVRPLGAIVLAYHAFVNVALYYVEVIQKRNNIFCEKSLDEIIPQLKIMTKLLKNNNEHLSVWGKKLVDPLYEKISTLYIKGF